MPGDEQDGCLAVTSDAGGRFGAVYVSGQIEIHQDQVRTVLSRRFYRVGRRAGPGGNSMSQIQDRTLQVEGDDRVIFHDQDSQHDTPAAKHAGFSRRVGG